MSHLVEQIVAAVAARLVAAGTHAGANVEADRDWPIAKEGQAFDWLLVNVGADRVTESTPMWPRRLTEEVEIRVRAISRVATAAGNPHARVRELLLQVQQALVGSGADIRLGGVAKFMKYAGSEPIEDELNLDVAARDISFIVTFQTKESSFEASA